MPRLTTVKWFPNTRSSVVVKCFPYFGLDGRKQATAHAKSLIKSTFSQIGSWHTNGISKDFYQSFHIGNALHRLLTRKSGPKNGV